MAAFSTSDNLVPATDTGLLVVGGSAGLLVLGGPADLRPSVGAADFALFAGDADLPSSATSDCAPLVDAIVLAGAAVIASSSGFTTVVGIADVADFFPTVGPVVSKAIFDFASLPVLEGPMVLLLTEVAFDLSPAREIADFPPPVMAADLPDPTADMTTGCGDVSAPTDSTFLLVFAAEAGFLDTPDLRLAGKEVFFLEDASDVLRTAGRAVTLLDSFSEPSF